MNNMQNEAASLLAQMESATSRRVSTPEDAETRALQSAFLAWGQLLEQQTLPIGHLDITPAGSSGSDDRCDTALPRYAWLSLAVSLLGFIFWSGNQLPTYHSPVHANLLATHSHSTNHVTPKSNDSSSATVWDDTATWEAKLQRAEEAMFTFHARSPDFTEQTAAWLNTSLQQIKSEIHSESM
jgi:hypothetical protein